MLRPSLHADARHAIVLIPLTGGPEGNKSVVANVTRVREAFQGSAIADIRLASNGDRGVLIGSVTSFYYKQLDQERVCRFVNGTQFKNALSAEY